MLVNEGPKHDHFLTEIECTKEHPSDHFCSINELSHKTMNDNNISLTITSESTATNTSSNLYNDNTHTIATGNKKNHVTDNSQEQVRHGISSARGTHDNII